MSNWPEIERQYYMRTFDRVPVVLVRGEGARVWDDAGKEYLDFFAGLAVNSLGHCHPAVVKAVAEQAGTLMQTSNLYFTVPQLRLAELLVKNSCLDEVFFCNSGAEANEGAVKLARRYGHHHRNGAYEVITALNSFHGRTLAMTAATGQPKFQKSYEPLTPGFVNVPYNSIKAIREATNERTCAVLLEPIQGEGGVVVPGEAYLAAVRQWCDEQGILFMLDEVQTGIGRLGTLFGYELFDVQPDVIALAKGLGGGVPIGAIMARKRASVFVPGEHGSTFGGNPLACAAGYATVKFILDNDVAGNAGRMGEYLAGLLEELRRKHGFVAEVRGRGLLRAMEFNSDISKSVMMACLEKGLLVNNVKPNALRLAPPLIIGKPEVDRAIAVLDEVLSGLII